MSNDLIFEEPPMTSTGRTSGGPITEWLDALRVAPGGRWSKFPKGFASQGCSGKASQIKKGHRWGVSAGEFDACTRRGEDGLYYLYARYIGNQS